MMRDKQHLIRVFLVDGPKDAFMKYRKLGRQRQDWKHDKTYLDEMIKEGTVKIVHQDRTTITYRYLAV